MRVPANQTYLTPPCTAIALVCLLLQYFSNTVNRICQDQQSVFLRPPISVSCGRPPSPPAASIGPSSQTRVLLLLSLQTLLLLLVPPPSRQSFAQSPGGRPGAARTNSLPRLIFCNTAPAQASPFFVLGLDRNTDANTDINTDMKRDINTYTNPRLIFCNTATAGLNLLTSILLSPDRNTDANTDMNSDRNTQTNPRPMHCNTAPAGLGRLTSIVLGPDRNTDASTDMNRDRITLKFRLSSFVLLVCG